MTTLAAWTGVDQRSPASIYIVSDSRFTEQTNGMSAAPRVLTDQGQKIFACQQEPHLFGYWGWVEFPSRTISKAVAAINGGSLFVATDDAAARHAKFTRFMERDLKEHLEHKSSGPEFAVLHAMREGSNMNSVFRLWILGWSPDRGWNIRERELTKKSEVIYAAGSGREKFLANDARWKDSELGRTSRGVFSAFVEALQARSDPASGGTPQLGGLFRAGRAMEFGIVYNAKRYLTGKPVRSSDVPLNLDWFNELFERADPVTLKRLPKAQRHAKPSWMARWNATPDS